MAGKEKGLCIGTMDGDEKTLAIHLEISGQRNKPALVLIHPLGGSSRFWDESVSHLIHEYQIVTYDLRGAGLSPVPVGPYKIMDHVGDLEDLRRRLGLKRIIPIGVAAGSMVAAYYAANYPERASALVLCNPVLLSDRATQKRIKDNIDLVRKEGIEAILTTLVDKAFNKMPRDYRYRRYFELFKKNDPKGFEYLAMGYLDFDLTPILPLINCPTLVTTGEYDDLFPLERVKQVKSFLPNALFKILSNAAHFPPFQNPMGFTSAVREFLSNSNAGF